MYDRDTFLSEGYQAYQEMIATTLSHRQFVPITFYSASAFVLAASDCFFFFLFFYLLEWICNL